MVKVLLTFAKSVERKATPVPLKITLRQTISRELSSPATSAIKLAGPEMVSENIKDNTKTNRFLSPATSVTKLSCQEMV